MAASGPQTDVFFLLIVITVNLVAFFGNLGTISAFATDNRVNTKPSDLLLLNLACVDFAIALIVMPLEQVTVNAIGKWPWGKIGCRLMVPIDMTLITAGIMSVILISFDRYQMLAMDYSNYVKKWGMKPMKRLIAVTWVVSLLPGVFETVTWDITLRYLPEQARPNFDRMCSQPSGWRLITNVVCVIFVAVIPTTVVTVLGFLIIYKLHQRLQQWRKVGYVEGGSTRTTGSTAKTVSQTLSNVNASEVSKVSTDKTSTVVAGSNGQRNGDKKSSKPSQNDLIRKRYIKPIVTYACLALCVAVCTFPICIYLLVMSTDKAYYFNPVLVKYLVFLWYSVSCWNPILYGLTNSKIREFYKRRVRAIGRLFGA